MQIQKTAPSQEFIWVDVLRNVDARLQEKASAFWVRTGMASEYGTLKSALMFENEAHELTNEIVGIVMVAIASLQDRANIGATKVGRPRDDLSRELGLSLLMLFLRCHDKAGRKSALTWANGDFAQEEVGEFFEFIKTVIEAVNPVLVDDLGRRPLSAVWVARHALAEHNARLDARRRHLVAH